MRRRRIIHCASSICLLSVAACSSTSGSGTRSTAPIIGSAPAETAGASGWEDEFDGRAGSAPDPSKWTAEIGGSGWGNKQLQYYTSTAARLDGLGDLVITAEPTTAGTKREQCWYGPCSYVSGRLTSYGKFVQRYGHFEARLRLPGGTATWPAVWMMGEDRYRVGWPDSGELDLAEHVGRDGGLVSGAAHGPGFSGDNALTADVTVDPSVFHVYSLDWTPDSVTWSVDGKPYHQITRSDTPKWVFDRPFFLILNLAIGGVHAGDPGAGDDQAQQLVIDYIKVTPLSAP